MDTVTVGEPKCSGNLINGYARLRECSVIAHDG